ncbi:MAG: hypothetical protein IIY70_00280 [Oscillospiraceae bacterium]|nr:hypothetical protein [Oscillospiraceae bacterium]
MRSNAIRRITALALTLLLAPVGSSPVCSAAENDGKTALPAQYDGREFGYVTPIRDQGQFETCWCFGTMASIEAYMVKHGIRDSSTGAPADLSLDLSESQLAWFSYTKAYDKLGLLEGDETIPEENYLMQASTNAMITYTLMRGAGPASESEKALAYRKKKQKGLDARYAYANNVAAVTDVTWIPAADRDAVKRAVMEYGAGSIAYHHDFACMDMYSEDRTCGYYCGGATEPNHLVCIVGWDDNFPRENFDENYRPEYDGAWLIKNSWGSELLLDGYFYLSYEECSANVGAVSFYKVEDLHSSRRCYQYDGTSNCISTCSMGNQCQIANIFTAAGTEQLQSVALAVKDQNTSYTLSIYQNPSSETEPDSGTLVQTQSGVLPFGGYHNIPLDTAVPLKQGDTFSVVFTLSTPEATEDGSYVHIPYDASAENVKEPDMENPVSWVHTDHGNSSFYREANGGWTDCPDKGDFRIKAYTDSFGALVAEQSLPIWKMLNAEVTRLLSCLLGR